MNKNKEYGYCSICGRENTSLKYKFQFNGVCYLCNKRANTQKTNANTDGQER